MKIITWNVNRFDGIWDWYEHKKDLPIDERKEYANKIIEKLRESLNTSEDIAILQEVPYRYFYKKDEWETKWRSMFEEFKVMLWFDDEPKRDGFNYDYSINVTIAVGKKESNWAIRPFNQRKIKFGETGNRWNYVNRYIELENGNMSILGLHLGESGQWKEIHSAANDSKFTFIVGDFNVNDLRYPSNKELNLLEEKYERMIDNDIITHNQALTSLDNIFVNKDFCANGKVSVFDYCFISEFPGEKGERKQKRYSDHNVCICEW